MASPDTDFNLTLIDVADNSTGQFTAPLLESAQTPPTFTNKMNGVGWDAVGNVTGLYGGRKALILQPSDLTTRKYIWFQLVYQSGNSPKNFSTLSGGGLRIIFVDSTGNWARFNIMGSDVFTDASVDGGFQSFKSLGIGRDSMVFVIDRTATPDAESASSINWSSISDIETHISLVSSDDPDLYFGRLNVADIPFIHNGDSGDILDLEEISKQNFEWPDKGDNRVLFAKPPRFFGGANGETYNCLYGLQIGKAGETTYFDQPRGQLAFYPSKDAQLSAITPVQGYGAAFTGNGQNGQGRDLLIYQEASDYCRFQEGFIFSGVSQSGGEYNITVQGSSSATCIFDRSIFINGYEITCAHSSLTAPVFDGFSNIKITSQTIMTNGSWRNGDSIGRGLIIDDIAGDYSNIGLLISDSVSGNEIEIRDHGGGVYDLRGIETEGQSINVHNEGANSVTILLASGIQATTSTSGGSINLIIDSAVVNVNVIDLGTKLPIQNARVLITDEPGVLVILSGITDLNGNINTSYSGSTPLTITGVVRKASLPGTRYKQGNIAGVITSIGFDATVQLISDE